MIKPKCFLQGDNLDIPKLEELLSYVLSNKEIKGDICKIGRFKNQPLPYSSGIIEPPIDFENDKKIEWLADFIFRNTEIFKVCGAVIIDFQIDWYGIQGNMSLSNSELKKLAELNLPINITYINE